MDLDKFRKLSEELRKENQKFYKNLKKKRIKNLDALFHDTHEEVFKETNCLECANCCKTTSPIFKSRDIKRIAKHFRMKDAQFIDQYLYEDEDDDYVLKSSPCAFLDADNYCSIYDVRPKACREFPHTDRKKFQQISNLTLKNVAICPAAYNIVEEMKKLIKYLLQRVLRSSKWLPPAHSLPEKYLLEDPRHRLTPMLVYHCSPHRRG